jgi:Rieske Fe-S protein
MKSAIFSSLDQKKYDRRDFLKDIAKSVSYITVGSFVISQFNACSDESNPTSPNNENTNGSLTIDISLAENNALSNIGGSIAINANDLDSKGMLVIRSGNNTVTALSRKCTHQGCTLPNFQIGSASCPCHGSKFDTSGNVVNGPATVSLKKYNATIDGNIITITA